MGRRDEGLETPGPTLLQPTRPDPRPYPQPSVHYPTPDTPYPLPTSPTPTPQPNTSTLPYTFHISYRSWVGWRQGRYGGYGEWEFGLGSENGVWRTMRLRSRVGGEDMVLYGDWVGISGVALCGYIHSSPYTIPIPDTPHLPNLLLLQIPIPHPDPTHLPNSSQPQPSSLPPLYAHPTAKTLISPNKPHTCHYGGFAVL